MKLIKYINTKYLEFWGFYSHLARYYSELNKENADIDLPQKHITDIYNAEFDSSKLELIYQLKNEVEQSHHPNEKISIKTWIKESLELSRKKEFVYYYLKQFNSEKLDSTILNLSHKIKINDCHLGDSRRHYKKSKCQLTMNI